MAEETPVDDYNEDTADDIFEVTNKGSAEEE